MPGTGEIIVDVRATPVLPYAKDIFIGSRNYPLAPPLVPGCSAVGQVHEVGPDAALQGGEDLSPPSRWFMPNNVSVRGQWMYAREDARKLVAQVRSKQLRLEAFALTSFALEHAAANAGAFRLTVLKP